MHERIHIGPLMAHAFRLSLRYLPGFFVLALVVHAPVIIEEILAGVEVPTPDEEPTLESMGLELTGLIVTQLLGAALAFVTVLRQEGRPCSALRGLEASLGKMFPILFVTLIPGIAFFASAYVGSLFLLIPAVFLLTMLYLAVPVLLLEDVGVLYSMRRSAHLTRGNRLNILIALAFVSLTAVLINQALLRVELSAYGILAIESVAGVLISIYSATILALIYMELRRVELDELLQGDGPSD